MARGSLSKSLEAHDNATGAGLGRFVQMQLDFVNQENGEVMERVGGVWDRGAEDGNGNWAGDAEVSMRIELHEGQHAALNWFVEWLDQHMAIRFDGKKVHKSKRTFSSMFAGGRRGGKSYEAVALTVAYAIAIPGSICWIVCPTDKHYDEIKEYLEDFMPKAWYEWLGDPHSKYMLANGSDIFLKSAHTPNTLKKGRVDFALLNEGQQMKERAYTTVRAATSDKGGLCLVACNPPDEGDIGLWVGDFAVHAQEGLRQAKYHFFDPLDNPNIDRDALLALADEMDPHTFDVQVRGMFLAPKGAVFYNWDRSQNEKPLPEVYDDITEKFTEHFEGEPYTNIVHIDVNRFPYIAAGVWKVVKNPRFPSYTRALAYCHDEVSLDGGDEHDVCHELIDKGYDPRKTLVVMDASGKWQSWATFGNNKVDKVPKLSKDGLSSKKIFEGHGFRVVKPDRRLEDNPNVIERCRAVCARIATKSKQRFLFVDPRCKAIAKAMSYWETKHGKPLKTSEYAHHGDGVGYFVWRFWPRRQSLVDRVDLPGKGKRRKKGVKHVY